MHELETALLASIIQRGGDDVLTKLDEDDFVNLNNKRTFTAVKNLWLKGSEISPITVKAEDQQIAIANILEMDDVILATKDEIDKVTEKIKNQSALRKIQRLLNKIKHTMQEQKDAKAIKTQIYEDLEKIDTNIDKGKIKDLKTVIFEATGWIEEQYFKAKSNDLMLTGIHDLDYYTGGIFDGEMTVIAARPSVGKTALALYIALKLSHEGRKVHFVSREMSHNALGMRIISMASGVSTGKIKSGHLTDDDWKKIGKSMNKFYNNKNLKIDTDSKTPSDIKAATKELQTKSGVDVVIIDYLQILTPDGKHSNREQEVASISRSLKNLSLDLNKPVIVLAQLSRKAENKRPTLGDLRESGAIEADADNIWFLHNPTIDQLDEDKMTRYRACKSSGYRYLEIIIGKHRNGPVGMIDVIFDPSRMMFIGFSNREETA